MAAEHLGESQAATTAAEPSKNTIIEAAIASMNLSPIQDLQSEDQGRLLDVIDGLREQQIDGIDPTQLIVCGERSTGKSSLLEAISGVPFPRGETFCTRFASEIVLRRDPKQSIRLKIIPHEQRPLEERKQLEAFSRTLETWGDLPGIIERANSLMGLQKSYSKFRSTFARDVLRIEFSGPTQPHLTLVDLPGIIHTTTDAQYPDDPQHVKDLVRSYMEKPSSIILAVVAASTDFGNQAVFDFVREVDPEGNRTLGIITKLDRVRAGSADERNWLQLAQNKTKALRLGWHVVKNVDTSEQNDPVSLEERDQQEQDFFRDRPFRTDPDAKLGVGIAQLRQRLGSILLASIQESLEPLRARIEGRTNEVRSELERLGSGRPTLELQRLHLTKISQDYFRLSEAAIYATYRDKTSFFSNYRYEHRHLCTNLMKLQIEFERQMLVEGQKWPLVSKVDQSAEGSSDAVAFLKAVAWPDWIERVSTVRKGNSGLELPGQMNGDMVHILFSELSASWAGLGRAYLEHVQRTVSGFIDDLLTHLTDEDTKTSIQTFWLGPKLEEIAHKSEQELEKLVKTLSHPSMLWKRGFLERMNAIHKHDASESGSERYLSKEQSEAENYIKQLIAYYLSVRETFIDNVGTIAVWANIFDALPEAFSSTAVAVMPADEIQKLAQEPENTVARREKLRKDLEVLKRGQNECERQLSKGKQTHSTPHTTALPSSPPSSESSSQTKATSLEPAEAETTPTAPQTPTRDASRGSRAPRIVEPASSPTSTCNENLAASPGSAAVSPATAATSPSPRLSVGSRRKSAVVNPSSPSPSRMFDGPAQHTKPPAIGNTTGYRPVMVETGSDDEL